MPVRHLIAGGLAVALSACSETSAPAPVWHAEDNPVRLSEWGMMRIDGQHLVLSDRVEPYELTTPLFTDYAHKQRTIWIPDGQTARYDEDGALDFPVGTVITKTFYYPLDDDGQPARLLDRSDAWRADGLDLSRVRLMETRILVHREDGWTALPYVWDSDQRDAVLARAGHVERMTLSSTSGDEPFTYVVPNANQCAGCHATNNTTRAVQPIGPSARLMNRDYAYLGGMENQLAHLVSSGLLDHWPGPEDTPSSVDYLDNSADLDRRARDYLDINCAHCHNTVGAADTSGLHLDFVTPLGSHYGLCKLPIAAGGGTGGRLYAIAPGEPDQSILLYRMESTDAGSMMPELGRSLVHDEGVALIREWISSLDGSCTQ